MSAENPRYQIGEVLLRRRVKSLQRRGFLPENVKMSFEPEERDRVFRHPLFNLDSESGRLSNQNGETTLSPTELKLANMLCESMGHVVNNKDLMEKVWEFYDKEYEHYVRFYIGQLKIKISKIGVANIIKNHWGRGYELLEQPEENVRSRRRKTAD